MTKGSKLETDPDVAAVIVGFDRNINYYKIQYATVCLREHPGCQFIATNLDAVTHLTDVQEWAGNGSMVRAAPGPEIHLLVTARVAAALPVMCDVAGCCCCMVVMSLRAHGAEGEGRPCRRVDRATPLTPGWHIVHCFMLAVRTIHCTNAVLAQR